MQDSIRNIKNIKIKQVFAALLVGCLLMVTTACSQGGVAQSGRETSKTYQGAPRDSYDNYDANQGFEGGMNGYDDDRRYDAGTAAKAKGLVDTAKNRQEDSLGEYVDSVTDRAENKVDQARKDIPRTLKSNQEDAVDYVQNKSDKLQRNLSKVPDGAQEMFDDATDTAQDALEDATKAAQNNAQRIKGNFEDLS